MTFDEYCRTTGHYAENGDRFLWETATSDEREMCAKKLELKPDDLRLMAGEMTTQEMRTVMAVLSCLRVRIRSSI